MNQFECVAVRLRAFVSQGEEIGGELVNDVIDDRIAGGCFPTLLSDCRRLPAKRRNRKWRFLESKTFDGLFEIHGRSTAFTPIDTGFSGQSRQPESPILSEPPMRCPVRNSRSQCYGPQRSAVFKVWLEDSKTIKRQLPGLFGKRRQLVGHTRPVAK